jgi:hypothetical protein
MTKTDYAKALVVLLDMEATQVAELNKLSVGTLTDMYNNYIKNAQEFQFQNERLNVAEKELRMWREISRGAKNK